MAALLEKPRQVKTVGADASIANGARKIRSDNTMSHSAKKSGRSGALLENHRGLVGVKKWHDVQHLKPALPLLPNVGAVVKHLVVIVVGIRGVLKHHPFFGQFATCDENALKFG